MIGLGFATATALVAGCNASEADGGCQTDLDCKGERVCVAKACQDPGPAGSGTGGGNRTSGGGNNEPPPREDLGGGNGGTAGDDNDGGDGTGGGDGGPAPDCPVLPSAISCETACDNCLACDGGASCPDFESCFDDCEFHRDVSNPLADPFFYEYHACWQSVGGACDAWTDCWSNARCEPAFGEK